MASPHICRHSVSNFLHVSLLTYKNFKVVPRIFGKFVNFWLKPEDGAIYHQLWHDIKENMNLWYTVAGRTARHRQVEYNKDMGMMPHR